MTPPTPREALIEALSWAFHGSKSMPTAVVDALDAYLDDRDTADRTIDALKGVLADDAARDSARHEEAGCNHRWWTDGFGPTRCFDCGYTPAPAKPEPTPEREAGFAGTTIATLGSDGMVARLADQWRHLAHNPGMSSEVEARWWLRRIADDIEAEERRRDLGYVTDAVRLLRNEAERIYLNATPEPTVLPSDDDRSEVRTHNALEEVANQFRTVTDDGSCVACGSKSGSRHAARCPFSVLARALRSRSTGAAK